MVEKGLVLARGVTMVKVATVENEVKKKKEKNKR
jgi:hypothetical protein